MDALTLVAGVVAVAQAAQAIQRHIRHIVTSTPSLEAAQAIQVIQRGLCHPPPWTLYPSRYYGITLKRQIPLKRHYEIEGTLNGSQVFAFPDTGAQKNVISLKYCEQLGLSIEKVSKLAFQLPSGHVVNSVGKTKLRWQFANESKYINANFHVVPNCTHDVILGSSFLKLTKSLTKFCHRIKTKWLPTPQRLGVKLLGTQRYRVAGYLDGNFVAANPDTGSDVMLMSKAYAEEHGYHIQNGSNFRSELEFADGSRSFTDGMVTGLEWSYGTSGTPYSCDFHVLENLPVDVVLSNDFLFDTQAFSKYEDYFYDLDALELTQIHELSLIKQIGWLGDRISRCFRRKTSKGLPTIEGDAFEVDEVRKELQLRDAADERIATLSGEDQVVAQNAETRRRLRWTPGARYSGNPLQPPTNASTRQNEWPIRIVNGPSGQPGSSRTRDPRHALSNSTHK